VDGATKDTELEESVYSYKINIVCLRREKRKRNGKRRRGKITLQKLALAESWLNFEGDSAWSRPTYYLEAVMPSAAELRPSHALLFSLWRNPSASNLPATSKSQGPAVAYFPLIMQ
jgi:hypothetical protein